MCVLLPFLCLFLPLFCPSTLLSYVEAGKGQRQGKSHLWLPLSALGYASHHIKTQSKGQHGMEHYGTHNNKQLAGGGRSRQRSSTVWFVLCGWPLSYVGVNISLYFISIHIFLRLALLANKYILLRPFTFKSLFFQLQVHKAQFVTTGNINVVFVAFKPGYLELLNEEKWG